MKLRLYDKVGVNSGMLLDLPFEEGTGIITQDVAKPHHPVTMANTPTWATLASGLQVIDLDGSTEYMQSLNASTADLGFTTGDFSLGVWINWTDNSSSSIIMGRYELNAGGWELYITSQMPSPAIVTLRHHHAGGSATRTACYSTAWTPATWLFCGVSRDGATAQHYRNGAAVTTTVTEGGLEDPEATTQDLVIGVRYTKNAAYYDGQLWRPRIWNRSLTATEWQTIYESERGWF